jgi:hypothetical protein
LFKDHSEAFQHISAPQNLDLSGRGEKMCGELDTFNRWFYTTFGVNFCSENIPAYCFGPIRDYMNYINSKDVVVNGQTLGLWKMVGRARFADFDKRQHKLIVGATLGRTRYSTHLTEAEAWEMIHIWRRETPTEPTANKVVRGETFNFTYTGPLARPYRAPAMLCLPDEIQETMPITINVINIPVEVDRAPLPVEQRRTNRDIPVRVDQPAITVVVAEVAEVAIPFKDSEREFVAYSLKQPAYEQDFVKPLYKVGKPIVVKAKTPARNPRFVLREFIASKESKRIQEYTRRRYDVMGHTSLIKATNEQLAAYAVSLGYSELGVNALFARHALGDRGESRRIA